VPVEGDVEAFLLGAVERDSFHAVKVAPGCTAAS
jgi:hypothetical protein